jgi:hypothetical protein
LFILECLLFSLAVFPSLNQEFDFICNPIKILSDCDQNICAQIDERNDHQTLSD